MIILVAVSVSIAVKGGLFGYASKARKLTLKSIADEEIQVALSTYKMDYIIKGEDTISFGDFMNASLTDEITAFVETEDDYTFNYKGFGYKINKENFGVEEITPAKVFYLITSEDELEENVEYIITSGISGHVNVLDELINGNEDELYYRGSILSKVNNNNTIYYNGDYTITLKKDGDNWLLYDSKNKEYLSTGSRENDINSLGLSKTKNEYTQFSISFNEEGNKNAIIACPNKENRNIIRAGSGSNTVFSCYNQDVNRDIYLFKYTENPQTKMLFTPSVKVSVENRKVTLYWNPIQGAANYTIIWNGEEIITTETKYVFSDLDNGTQNTYQVRANKSVNDATRVNSDYTDEKVVVPSIGEYKLVTSSDDISTGARYLVSTDYLKDVETSYIMGSQGKKNRPISETSIVNNIIKHDGEYTVMLERDGNSDYYRIKDVANSQYVYSDATGSMYIGNKLNNDNQLFKVNIIYNGDKPVAVLESKKVGDLKLQYNSSSKIFAFYTSSQQPIYLYKEIGSAKSTQLATPIVTATGESESVTLSWEKSNNAVSYTIEWNGDSSNLIENITTSSYTIDELESGQTYTYRVKAIGNNNPYASSNWVEGSVNTVKVEKYVLVSDINDIEADTDYIITNSKTIGQNAKALGEANKNNRAADDVKIQKDGDNNIVVNYSGLYKLRLEYDSGYDKYTFYDAYNDLYLYSTGKNLMLGEKRDNAYFTIEIDAKDRNVIISYMDDYSMRYNTANGGLFCCYTSGQQPVYLYKIVTE